MATQGVMTKEQVDAVFSGKMLEFVSYYKYTFTLSAQAPDEDLRLECTVGGDEEVYYFSFRADGTGKENRFTYVDDYRSVRVYANENRVELFGYYEPW